MNPIFHRCRHTNVTWLDSHSCQCGDCHKVGHWFENEGIVMWVQAKHKSTQLGRGIDLPATSEPASAVAPTAVVQNTVAQNAVA